VLRIQQALAPFRVVHPHIASRVWCNSAAGVGKVEKNGPGTSGKFKEGQRVTAGGWCASFSECTRL